MPKLKLSSRVKHSLTEFSSDKQSFHPVSLSRHQSYHEKTLNGCPQHHGRLSEKSYPSARRLSEKSYPSAPVVTGPKSHDRIYDMCTDTVKTEAASDVRHMPLDKSDACSLDSREWLSLHRSTLSVPRGLEMVKSKHTLSESSESDIDNNTFEQTCNDSLNNGYNFNSSDTDIKSFDHIGNFNHEKSVNVRVEQLSDSEEDLESDGGPFSLAQTGNNQAHHNSGKTRYGQSQTLSVVRQDDVSDIESDEEYSKLM